MHNLTAKEYIREIVMNLELEHKEILFFLGIRLYSPKKLAALRGQTDRNVRKVRDAVQRKIQRKLYAALVTRKQNGASMTLQEKEFMAQYESAQTAKKSPHNIREKNGLLYTDFNRTVSDALANEAILDMQGVTEAISKYYYRNGESFEGISISPEYQEKFDRLAAEAIDYYAN